MTLIAHHIILTGYGHWLPNDPRGSMSHEIRAPKIAELGPPHHGRKPIQPSLTELREFHQAAKESLALPVLWWDDAARQVLADAFGEAAASQGLTCYACAVVRNHAHLLLRRHRLKGEEMRDAMKKPAATSLWPWGLFPKIIPFSAPIPATSTNERRRRFAVASTTSGRTIPSITFRRRCVRGLSRMTGGRGAGERSTAPTGKP